MARAVFAINDFVQFANGDLAIFGLNVGSKMEGNTYYPTPPVAAAIIKALASTFQNKLAAAVDGGIVQTAEAKQARINLINALKQTTRYINVTTYNNAVAIESAGFNASSAEPETPHAPAKPQLKVRQGEDAGTAIIEILGEKGVKAYTAIIYDASAGADVQVVGTGIRISGAASAQVLTETDGNMIVTGLTSGARYNVAAFVVNTGGRSPLSDVLDVVTR